MESPITPDEQKMAGLAQLLGVIVALPVWLMWRKRSAFVRLHAVQSILLDVALLIVVVVLMAVLVAGVASGAAQAGKPDASLAAMAVTMFGMPLCSLAGLLVVLTVVLVLRLRASVWALQGREYRYPLLGRWG
jgi:uncharacterized Tic20 family protein